MKSILLASVAVVGLAGAAAAEVTFSGDATLGYNDTEGEMIVGGVLVPNPDDNNYGFYAELNLSVAFSTELDYGVTVSAGVDAEDVGDADSAGDGGTDDFGGAWIKIASDMGSLTFGDTTFAPEDYWTSAGDMEADSFSEADGETVLKGDFTFGTVSAGVSYVLADADGDFLDDNGLDPLDQLGIGLTGTFGNFTAVLAYQEESQGASGLYDPAAANGDFHVGQVWGVAVSTTFGAADITVAYADEDDGLQTSAGVKVSYPFGPVTLTAYYVSEGTDLEDLPGTPIDESDPDDNYGLNVAYANGPVAVALDYQDDQGVQKVAIDGSYALDNGLTIFAGAFQEEDVVDIDGDDVIEYYVAGELDLGGGASLLISYADAASTNEDDEIGANDYQEGVTVEATFEF